MICVVFEGVSSKVSLGMAASNIATNNHLPNKGKPIKSKTTYNIQYKDNL